MALLGKGIVAGGDYQNDSFTTGGGLWAFGSNGNLAVNTDKFTVNATTGAVGVGGTLNSAGAFSVATSKFTVSAAGVVYADSTLSAKGNLWVGHATEASALFDVVASNGNLRVGTAAATKFSVAGASGNVVSTGTGTFAGLISSAGLRLTQSAPASKTAAGTAGDVAVDANYVYVCAGTGAEGAANWKRVSLVDTAWT